MQSTSDARWSTLIKRRVYVSSRYPVRAVGSGFVYTTMVGVEEKDWKTAKDRSFVVFDDTILN